MTPDGLNMYFRLLTWLQELDRQTVFSEMLGQLHSLATRIKELRNPLYNILRTHFNIGALVFEQDLFSAEGVETSSSSASLLEN